MEVVYYAVLLGCIFASIGVIDTCLNRCAELNHQVHQAKADATDARHVLLLRRKKLYWRIMMYIAFAVFLWLFRAFASGESAFPWWVT
jgi:hypothetical protein